MNFTYPSGARPLDGFTIKRGIGSGGFGEVYHAVSDAGKEVALKRLKQNVDVELRGVTQCLNLKHPHLVEVYDVRHDDDGDVWVVMEYVAGGSLKDLLAHHPSGLPPAEVLRWFRGMAAAVAFLHDHGIVHRDLKPANIFDDQGVVKVGDLGLSKYITCSRRMGNTQSIGTCHYMAPEIGKGQYGKEVDVYALGIVLYEMLTGRVPFDGESQQEVMMKHLVDEPDVCGIAEPFRSVIQRALAKDPARRFSSVTEMLDALEASVSSEPDVVFVERTAAAQGAQASAAAHGHAEPEIIWGSVCVERLPVRPHRTPRAVPRPNRQRSVVGPVTGPVPVRPRNVVGVGLILWTVVALVCLWIVGRLLFEGPPVHRFPQRLILPAVGLIIAGIAMYRHIRHSTNPATQQRAELRNLARIRWQAEAQEFLRSKSAFVRIRELLDSWLLSAGWCLVLTGVTLALLAPSVPDTVQRVALAMWLFVQSTLGSWLVLLTGKAWERSGQSQLPQLILIAAGALVGASGWAMQNFCGLTTEHLIGANRPALLELDALGASLVYFAGLMVLPMWKRCVDPLREKRFGWGRMILAAVWGWVLHFVVPVTASLGMAVATTMAIALQLSHAPVGTQVPRGQSPVTSLPDVVMRDEVVTK